MTARKSRWSTAASSGAGSGGYLPPSDDGRPDGQHDRAAPPVVGQLRDKRAGYPLQPEVAAGQPPRRAGPALPRLEDRAKPPKGTIRIRPVHRTETWTVRGPA